MNTTVYFNNLVNGEKAVSHFNFESQDFLDYIEEQLYILWEFKPTPRDWKRRFRQFRFAQFDYHGMDFVNMRERWLKTDGSEIEITLEEV